MTLDVTLRCQHESMSRLEWFHFVNPFDRVTTRDVTSRLELTSHESSMYHVYNSDFRLENSARATLPQPPRNHFPSARNSQKSARYSTDYVKCLQIWFLRIQLTFENICQSISASVSARQPPTAAPHSSANLPFNAHPLTKPIDAPPLPPAEPRKLLICRVA